MNDKAKPKVTITLELSSVHDLFAAGNWSCGAAPTSLDMALNVIEHGASELHVLHDALRGVGTDGNRIEELAAHAWCASIQLLAGLKLVRALQSGGAS